MDLPHFPRETSIRRHSTEPRGATGLSLPHDDSKPEASLVAEWNDIKEDFQRNIAIAKERSRTLTAYDKAAIFLPFLGWIRGYKVKQWLIWDLLAGITVGFMVVPQGMSYAVLAGVPPVFGLYGAFIPVIVYSLFGSSKQLGVGPVAVTSLLIANGVQNMVPYSSWLDPSNPPASPLQAKIQDTYNTKVIQLAFIVSCLYTGIGLLRLGWVVRFLSHAVITGFTSGAAFIIAASQVKYIVGYSVPRKDTLHENIDVLIKGRADFMWQECVMGCLMILWLVGLRLLGKWKPKLFWLSAMGPISACAIGIIVVAAGKFYNGELKIVGTIPAGMPPFTVGKWAPVENIGGMMRLAFLVLVIDLLESTSIARALARKNGYRLAFNREIIGLGLANFAGAMFSCYTTTGSFSRSAVNNASGAKTQLAGTVCGLVVMFVLLFLTPVFSKLPYNVIGAIIIVGVSQLVEFGVAYHLFKTHIRDFFVWLVAFLCTLFLGVDIGLGISIGLALLIVVFESAFPHTAVLGRVSGTGGTVYRSIEQYPDAKVVPGIVVIRIDAPAYFANVQWIQEKIADYEEEGQELAKAHGVEGVKYVILDMSPVTRIDATGIHAFEEELTDLGKRGVQLVLANPSAEVVRTLRRTGFLDHIGREWVFVSSSDAVAHCAKLLSVDNGPVQFVDPIRKYSRSPPASVRGDSVSANGADAIAGGKDVTAKDVDSLA